jgi:hypothetical protein
MLPWADLWDTDAPPDGAAAYRAAGRAATSPADLAALDRTLAALGEQPQPGADPRLVTFRTLFAPTAERLLRALAREIEPGDLLAALLRMF